MSYTLISSKFQVVIPKEIREKTNLKPGQKLLVTEDSGVVCLVPELSFKELGGIFRQKKLSNKNIRDKS